MAVARKDLLTRLADLSEDAIQRLAEVPGGERVFGAFNSLRDQLGELQKRVRGLEDLERRLAALEKKVDRLAKGSVSPSAARRSPAPRARKTAKKS
jgi:uncharacterized membrane protein YccC